MHTEDEMSNEEPLLQAIERMEALADPSIKTVTTTFAALKRTVDTVSADCRAVSETLEALGDALHMITQGAGAGSDLSGFGMIGLPVLGAIRAVKGIASQYVRQQTGTPLSAWTDLVASSSTQFEEYLSQLDTVARLSQRYHAPAEGEIDLRQVREDQQILRDARWQTQAWKQILSQVAQLGQLVEAILQVNLGGEPRPPEATGAEKSSAFSASLQRRIKEVQSRTVEKTDDLREWVLQPFVEIRDRVRQLPGRIAQLSREVAFLEVLLELEIAEMQACLGEISRTEARIVGMRVTANVILPELAQRLADARHHVTTQQAYLERLNAARDAGQVGDQVYSILSTEYQKGLESSQSRRAALEAEAEVWRREGQAVLDACTEWVTLEMDVLAARRLAEQEGAADDRRPLLRRELERLDEVRHVLAAL
jgi:hypothetical protein